MGFPPNPQVLRPTRPYYRSSYVFVHKPDLPTIRSFDDPALRKLTVGVQLIGDDGANTPPVHALAQRGIVANVRGFMVYGNAQAEAPLSPVVDAVADGRVDVAIVWGPAAGYFVKHAGVPLRLTPVLIDPAHLALPMTFDIAAGVRKEDQVLATEINNALTARKADIDAVLAEFGVPRVDAVSTVDLP
jgi:mxaJ protein